MCVLQNFIYLIGSFKKSIDLSFPKSMIKYTFTYHYTSMNKQCVDEMQFHGQVTVWTKGQIVIPKDVRNMLEIQPWDSLAVITRHGKAIWLVPSGNMREMLAYLNGEIKEEK